MRSEIWTRRQRESIKRPIRVPVSPSNAVECYPCREVPLNYNRSLLFHGGDTGPTPVRDANILKNLWNPTISPRVQKSPLINVTKRLLHHGCEINGRAS